MSRQLRPEPVPIPARWDPSPTLAAKVYRFGWPDTAEWLGEVRYVSTLHGWVWQATTPGEKEVVTHHAKLADALAAVQERA